jgi:hypothetical protein
VRAGLREEEESRSADRPISKDEEVDFLDFLDTYGI